MKIKIDITAYAPQVFKFIRHLDGIDEVDIINSVDPMNNKFQIFKSNKGQKNQQGGKSGSFFFFTQDKKYIIKTMSEAEKTKYL